MRPDGVSDVHFPRETASDLDRNLRRKLAGGSKRGWRCCAMGTNPEEPGIIRCRLRPPGRPRRIGGRCTAVGEAAADCDLVHIQTPSSRITPALPRPAVADPPGAGDHRYAVRGVPQHYAPYVPSG